MLFVNAPQRCPVASLFIRNSFKVFPLLSQKSFHPLNRFNIEWYFNPCLHWLEGFIKLWSFPDFIKKILRYTKLLLKVQPFSGPVSPGIENCIAWEERRNIEFGNSFKDQYRKHLHNMKYIWGNSFLFILERVHQILSIPSFLPSYSFRH